MRYLLKNNLLSPGCFLKMDSQASKDLNIVRGFSAFIVVFAYAFQIFISPYWYPRYPDPDRTFGWFLFQYIGEFGVMIFFSLSGYLIYQTVKNNIVLNNCFNYKQFALSRFVRLWPPLAFSLFLVLMIHFLFLLLGIRRGGGFYNGPRNLCSTQRVFIDWVDILGSAFFVNTIVNGVLSPVLNGPLWSVAFEFWFYVCIFLLIALVRFNLLVAVIFSFLLVFFAYKENDFWLYGFLVWLAAYGMAFLEGRVNARQFYSICFLGCAIFVAVWILFILNRDDTWYQYRNYYALGMAFSIVLPVFIQYAKRFVTEGGCATVDRVRFNKLFLKLVLSPLYYCTARLEHMAKYAYVLYLIHFPMFVRSPVTWVNI